MKSLTKPGLGTASLSAIAAIGLLAGGVAQQADASLIATDHFLSGNPADTANGEYSPTHIRRSQTNGAGQNPTIAGFTGAWTGNVTSGSLAVAQWTAQTAPTDSPLAFQDGGRARFGGSSAVNSLQRRVQRELSGYTPSDTYYISLITQIATGDLAGADGFVGAGFTNTDASVTQADANIVGGSALRGVLIGAASSDGSTTDFVIRHVGSSGVVQNDILASNIANIESTFTVLKIQFNDDPSNPNGNSKISVWHNPTDISTEAAATLAQAPLEFRTFALDTNADITHLTMTGLNYSKAASFDEPRFATSWEGAVPEPTTAGLALALSLGMVTRRWR